MVHISKHSLFSWCWNSEDHGRLPDKHTCPSIHFFTALTLSRPRPVACRAHFQAFAQNLYTRRGLLGPHCKKKSELWARPPVLTPVPSQAIHSSPPIKTGRLLGPCLGTLLRNWHSCWTPWSVFRKSNGGSTEKTRFFCLSLSRSLGLVVRTWKHGCGPGHTRQLTRENRERR